MAQIDSARKRASQFSQALEAMEKSDHEYVYPGWKGLVTFFCFVIVYGLLQFGTVTELLVNHLNSTYGIDITLKILSAMNYCLSFLYAILGIRTFRLALMSSKQGRFPINGHLIFFKTKVCHGKEARPMIVYNLFFAVILGLLSVFSFYVAGW